MTTNERPHLLLFCIDALRADCLSAYSFPGSIWSRGGLPATPALDEIAAHAWAYKAVAASSWTKPSVPSILQSLHPSEHGVLEVSKGRRRVATVGLPEGAPTLAEQLKRLGYRTHGLAHNAQLDPSLGFSRGFDTYRCDAGDGDSILDRLREIDPFGTDEPVFLYLHYIEPHWPYRGEIARRAETDATGRFPFHRFDATRWKELKRGLKKGGIRLTPDEVGFLRLVYRRAVEQADAVVGRCLEWLEQQGVLGNSVLVLTSDHGEELLDHGLVGHGQSLHEELVRVPLLVRRGTGTPGGPTVGRAITGAVGHVDILPTLLAAAGAEPARTAAGRALHGPAETTGTRYAFSEVKHKRRYHQAVHDGRYKLIRSFRFSKSRSGNGVPAPEDYNNLEDLFAGRPHEREQRFYDVSENPCERESGATPDPRTRARLESVLDTWWERRRHFQAGTHDLEDEMIRRLEALGYL